MSETATLYRIDRNDFHNIEEIFDYSSLLQSAKQKATFYKTFEGLRYLLSRGRNGKTSELVAQIFYPSTFIGKQVDYLRMDFDDRPGDFSEGKQLVYFNNPRKVAELSNMIDTFGVEQIRKHFDPDKMNLEAIVPVGMWNHESADGFSLQGMLLEFQKLSDIFRVAKAEGDFMVSFVQ